MRIQKQVGIWMITLAFTLVGSGSAFAKSLHKVILDKTVTVHGTQIAAGEYQVTWETHSPEATVTFKHKKVVATTEGKLEIRPERYDYDSVVYTVDDNGTPSILEIRFGGSNEVLTFNAS